MMNQHDIHFLDSLPEGLRLAYCRIPEGNAASRRSRETDAVRRLLNVLLGPDANMAHHENGAPYISDLPEMSISVTHSRKVAAVAVCTGPDTMIGIDAEEWRTQLERVAPRILSPEEIEKYSGTETHLLAAWTMKEALFKAALTPGTDFARDINLPMAFEIPLGNQAQAVVNGKPYHVIFSSPLPEFPETWLTVVIGKILASR